MLANDAGARDHVAQKGQATFDAAFVAAHGLAAAAVSDEACLSALRTYLLAFRRTHLSIRSTDSVQFALKQMAEGVELIPATLEAVRLRLRPILMTSLAFGGGVLPLAIATGAGSGSQNAIGTGVFGGMVAATALGCCSCRCSSSL